VIKKHWGLPVFSQHCSVHGLLRKVPLRRGLYQGRYTSKGLVKEEVTFLGSSPQNWRGCARGGLSQKQPQKRGGEGEAKGGGWTAMNRDCARSGPNFAGV